MTTAERFRIFSPNGLQKPEHPTFGPLPILEQFRHENRVRDWIWTNRHETHLSTQICTCLQDEDFYFNQEYRIPDIGNHTDWRYVAVDLAYIGPNGEREIAIEVKHKDTRSEMMRGLGQCLVYKHKGFKHVILASTYSELDMAWGAAIENGIIACNPWEVVDAVKAILRPNADNYQI